MCKVCGSNYNIVIGLELLVLPSSGSIVYNHCINITELLLDPTSIYPTADEKSRPLHVPEASCATLAFFASQKSFTVFSKAGTFDIQGAPIRACNCSLAALELITVSLSVGVLE